MRAPAFTSAHVHSLVHAYATVSPCPCPSAWPAMLCLSLRLLLHLILAQLCHLLNRPWSVYCLCFAHHFSVSCSWRCSAGSQMGAEDPQPSGHTSVSVAQSVVVSEALAHNSRTPGPFAVVVNVEQLRRRLATISGPLAQHIQQTQQTWQTLQTWQTQQTEQV